ncbi:unnamed protein product [Pedinophyceae sp. YPF-701]|nr:unnamed protein product [Pedinophyceae sp. YPF-701]
MPTPEQLAAAQAAAHAAAEDEQVGPEVPLDLEETDDARVAEVRRIMGVLAQAPKGPDGQPRAEAMAYEVVGVERGASAAQVRRRYMRSSLLVHPDKCDHPEARAAFQALSKVAAQLQDAEGRAVVEGAVEDQEMWELAKTVAAQQERAGAWERVRGGGGTPGAGLTGPELPQARDTWMTDLPALPTRAAGAEGITSKTAFAQNSREVGDRSGWLTVGGAAPAAPPGPAPASLPRGAYVSSAALRGEPEAKAPAASGGAATARQSLLERHQEELKKQKKSRKEAEKKEERGGKAAGESWKGVHPWRPFDREKDLEAPRQGAVLDKGKVQEGFLSRFRSAGS